VARRVGDDAFGRRLGHHRAAAGAAFRPEVDHPVDLDVIAEADWVIDLGPEGGAGGGTVVAEATPEGIVANTASHTGVALRPVLAREGGLPALAAA